MKDLRIEIDDKSGFCFGVVRAISEAEKALAGGETVYSLGDIVHNRIEVQRLEKLGLSTVTHADMPRLTGRRQRLVKLGQLQRRLMLGHGHRIHMMSGMGIVRHRHLAMQLGIDLRRQPAERCPHFVHIAAGPLRPGQAGGGEEQHTHQ